MAEMGYWYGGCRVEMWRRWDAGISPSSTQSLARRPPSLLRTLANVTVAALYVATACNHSRAPCPTDVELGALWL